jgi:hypothetical protein
MTVTILPVFNTEGEISFEAVSGNKSSLGKTPGEALDAISVHLSDDQAGTLVVIQSFRPDRFFSASEQRRLSELLERRSRVHQQGGGLPESEQVELEALIEAEVRAAGKRAAALADELGR